MSSSDSDSDSSQTQIQDTQDNRITAAEGSINLVTSRSNGNNINVTQTDFGTVNRSFDFAEKMAAGAASEAAASASRAEKVMLSSMQSVQNAYAGVNQNLADAYETAKAGEQKVMVMAGLAVVGLVAAKALGSRA